MTSHAWIDPLEGGEWDGLAMRHPEATAFHTSGWARVLNDAYGYRPSYLCVPGTAEVATLIPVVEIASVITGRRGSCLPFTDECPPLLAPGAQLDEATLAPLVERGRRRRWRYLELRTSSAPSGAAPSAEFLVHEVALSGGEDELWASLSRWGRRMVGRSRGHGVEVAWSRDRSAIDAYFAMHALTRRRHGVPPQPRRFFHAVHERLIEPGRGLVGLAHHDGALVAGIVVLHTERHAMAKFGASYPAARGVEANHRLLWEAIRRCAGDGFERLDLGRTDLGAEGLAAYKRGFGADERHVRYHRLPLSRGAAPKVGVAPTAAGEDGIGRRVFRAMPLPLLSLCGRLMYRHVG